VDHSLEALVKNDSYYVTYAHHVNTSHRGCVISRQMRAIKELVEDDPTKMPGYERISEQSQEQVRLAFENGQVIDKDFKDIRTGLATKIHGNYGEITDALGYKVDITRAASAMCRNAACPRSGVKIPKGELRLGIEVTFDGDHFSWKYKHWQVFVAEFAI
jgi:hypothetical protein